MENIQLSKLLDIQNKIQKSNMTKEEIAKITNTLTKTEKQQLKNLYKEQIEDLNIKINKCKNKIKKIIKKGIV